MNPLIWYLVLFHALPSTLMPPSSVPLSIALRTRPTEHRSPATLIHDGRATFYSEGLMEAVARKRSLSAQGASGFSTYPDCNMIGRYLWVSVLNPHTLQWSRWDVKRIVDCSQPRDYARHVAEGLVELSYQDAVRYGYSGEGHTQIKFYLEGK